MRKKFIAHMLSGKELWLNLFALVLILACLVWYWLDEYGDSRAGLMATAFTLVLLFNWVYSYITYKP